MRPHLGLIVVFGLITLFTGYLVVQPARAQGDFDCSTATDVPQSECEALVALYNATAGDNWTNKANWLASTALCTWHGVSCSDDQVRGLFLDANNLAGSLPAEIGNLTNLTQLYLSGNQLTGSLPPEIGNLTNLQNLYLFANELTGNIPPELGNLTNLLNLFLGDNNLSGSIPAELGNLTNVGFLTLDSNNLSGSIPAELANLTNLTSLWLHTNNLSGSIPNYMGNFSNLAWLYLFDNQLTGSIPSGIGALPNLTKFIVNDNYLSGQVPASFTNIQRTHDGNDLVFNFSNNALLRSPEVAAHMDTYEWVYEPQIHEVRIELTLLDKNNLPIPSPRRVRPGSEVRVAVRCLDTRDDSAVFSCYHHLFFNPQLFQAAEIIRGDAYQNGPRGIINNEAGAVLDVGAFAGILKPSDALVYTLEGTVEDAGILTFSTGVSEGATSDISPYGTNEDKRHRTAYERIGIEIYACPGADVNQNGVVSPTDASIVIGYMRSITALLPEEDQCIDVNDDGIITQVDVMLVINVLNSAADRAETVIADSLANNAAPDAAITLAVRELDATPGILPGETFAVDLYARDGATPTFSGYSDVRFDPATLRVTNIVYNDAYSAAREGVIDNQAGVVRHLGATSEYLNAAAIGDAPAVTLAMVAIAAGETTLSTRETEGDFRETVAYGLAQDLRSQTSYGQLTLVIAAVDGQTDANSDGLFTIQDVIYLGNRIGQAAVGPLAVYDRNANDRIDEADVRDLLERLHTLNGN